MQKYFENQHDDTLVLTLAFYIYFNHGKNRKIVKNENSWKSQDKNIGN